MWGLIYDTVKSFGVYLSFLGFMGLFCIDSLNKNSIFPGSITYKRILETRIFDTKSDCNEERSAFLLEKWTLQHYKKNGLSHHWWFSELPYHIRSYFEECGHGKHVIKMFRTLFYENHYEIVNIPMMDELYLTGNNQHKKLHSDQVFYTKHIDGPFSFIPYCSVFRCLIAINDNNNIQTEFPMANYSKKLNRGEVLAFDFNREIHNITCIDNYDSNTEPRIVLKSHFCIYPKGWNILGKLACTLNGYYNYLFRQLFLTSIEPTTFFEVCSSAIVMYGTYFFVYSDLYIGHKNILYTSALFYTKQYYSDEHLKFILYGTFFCKHVHFILSNHPEKIDMISYLRDSIFYLVVAIMS